MFEPTTPQSPVQNPLNPVMPSAGMSNAQFPAPLAPTPISPPSAPVHTMPERFRSTGSAPGGTPGSGKTKKLIITLIIVVVVAGLGVAGLYIFNRVVKSNNNNANANITNAANLNSTNTELANLNTNTADTNLNTNSIDSNTNTDVNVNVATNDNSNISANTNTGTNTNNPTNTNISTVTGPLPSTLDQDNDGLTDSEELVYGTDASNADSDGDTFVDGLQTRPDGTVVGELGNLYNPKGAGTLDSSSLVKRIENSTKTFSLLVPTSWTINESSGLLVITPTAQTGEFFQVRVIENTTNQTLQQWYQSNNPQANMSLVKSVAVNGLEGLVSEDGANVYFSKDTKIYGLIYTATGLSQVNYRTTFTMMMMSFKLVAAS